MDTTIVHGQPLMLHRKIMSLGVEKVRREAQDAALIRSCRLVRLPQLPGDP